jgi:multicomponent Na+:H+ antiporter subunit G
MADLIGALLALLGAFFLLLASLGLIRMPDVYNRMQAGTKATTLGSILIFGGVAFLAPAHWPRCAVLVLFIFLTNPLSSHALARSAHFQGIPAIIPGKSGRDGATRDDLATATGNAPHTDSGGAR